NLLFPYLVVQEIWRASNPAITHNPTGWKKCRGSYLVVAWWLTLLGAGMTPFVGSWVFGDGQRDLDLHARLFYVSNLLMVVAGVALILVVRDIHNRQRQRHAKLYDDQSSLG